MDNKDLIHRIDSSYKRMSKGQKLIAEYIMNNYDKAAFMTASRLGNNVGVSESTVVRFANALNYEGYPKLQKALQELIRNKLTTVQRIELSADMDQSMVLKNVLKADMHNIRNTVEEANNEVFNAVIEKILNAKNIYVLGLRSSAPLAQFMGYYLNFIFSNVRIVTSGINDIFEQLFHIG
ncbi:MAG: MurR/RpiR family transcriptional regulator, partial [Clostridia bacterium]|nr:MurR/RpiR family transcriptional regulator [Clostridia bacterium]